MPAKKKVDTLVKLNAHELDIKNRHDGVSKETTSPLYVQKRPGKGGGTFDFVNEGYMRQILNDNYPVWSWEVIKYEFLGKEAVAVHGRLMIVEDGSPRYFDALAAHQMSVSRETGVYIDLGNDMKSANTEAFKVACNRLCNISDDVYRKSVLSKAQLDTIEGVIGDLDGQTRRKVRESIGTNVINPSTFDTAMERLLAINEDKEKNNG